MGSEMVVDLHAEMVAEFRTSGESCGHGQFRGAGVHRTDVTSKFVQQVHDQRNRDEGGQWANHSPRSVAEWDEQIANVQTTHGRA